MGTSNTSVKPQYQQSLQAGSGFTNLNRILMANANNRLAGNVAGRLGQQIGQIGGQLEGEKKQFEETGKKAFGDLSSEGTQVGSKLDTLTDSSVTKAGEFDKATQAAMDAYTNWQNKQFQAPSTAALQNLSNTAQNLQGLYNAGESSLIGATMNTPQGYTKGQKNLDTFLLKQEKSPALDATKKQVQDVTSKAKQYGSYANIQPSAYEQRLKDLKTKTTEDTTKKYKDIGSGIESNLENTRNALNEAARNITKFQNQRQVEMSPEAIKALGLTYGSNISGLTPETLTGLSNKLTAENVTNMNDFAKYLALQKLASGTDSKVNLSNIGNVGTAKDVISGAITPEIKAGSAAANAYPAEYEANRKQISDAAMLEAYKGFTAAGNNVETDWSKQTPETLAANVKALEPMKDSYGVRPIYDAYVNALNAYNAYYNQNLPLYTDPKKVVVAPDSSRANTLPLYVKNRI